MKAGFQYLSTDDRFAAVPGFDQESGGRFASGDRTPFFFGGKNRTATWTLDAWLGLIRGWEAHGQIPVYRSTFTDTANPNRPASSGFGDLRLSLKRRVTQGPIATAVEVGVKAPTGKSQGFGDSEVVPLGEGQWDAEVIGHLGHSFWPVPAYAEASAGYRVRGKNDANGFDPGDEWLGTAAVGGHLGLSRFDVRLGWDWLYGRTTEAAGVTLDQRREFMSLGPTVGYRVSPGVRLESGVRIALRGQDYPAGVTWSFGVTAQN